MYILNSDLGCGLDRLAILQTVQKQIDLLKFTAWSSQEVIESLNKLYHHLQVQAAWENIRHEKLGFVNFAAVQRCCLILRLYIPDAICILQSDPTLHRSNGWDGRWVDTYAIEDQAICILERALQAANPSRSFI